MKRAARQHRTGKFTDQLRQRTLEKLGACPTCGAINGTYRARAKRLRVNQQTLWRFLRGGDPSAPLVDKLMGWLDNGSHA